MTANDAMDDTGVRRKRSEQIVGYLVRAILSGELSAGDRIDIDAVARGFDVSRIPVREALLVLEHEGLTTNRYHRSVRVAHLDDLAIREHFELYGLLGGVARRRMVERGDLERPLEQLAATLDALERTDPVDVDRIELLAREFLAVIHQCGGGPRLRSMLASFRHVLPYAYGLIRPTADARIVETFRHDLAALEARDGDRAAALVQSHMSDLADRVITAMRAARVLD